MTVPSSDLNPLAASAYFPLHPEYYSPGLDGCLSMPEVPPFPFNSAGTVYMYPTSIPIHSHPTRSSSYSHSMNNRRVDNDNGTNQVNGETTMNSNSSPSKDSNDTSITDSTSNEDDHLHQTISSNGNGSKSLFNKKEEEEEDDDGDDKKEEEIQMNTPIQVLSSN